MPHDALRIFMDDGVSVVLATADADGIPSCCRAVAITSRDEFETLTIYVPAATAQETIANVATTRRVAVSATRPLSHQSVQVKGITRGVRLAPAADEAFVRAKFDSFAAVLDQIGLPRRRARSIAQWPAFAIDITIEEIFDQTPGPKAGSAIA